MCLGLPADSFSSNSGWVKGGLLQTILAMPCLPFPQVTNMVGGKGQYNKRVESLVAECVAHLAVALGKDDLWQKLNYQLLLKTRHKKRYVSRLL